MYVEAFYAQWIVKYVDPRCAPWKSVLNHWIANNYHAKRTVFLTDAGLSANNRNCKFFTGTIKVVVRSFPGRVAGWRLIPSCTRSGRAGGRGGARRTISPVFTVTVLSL